MDTSLPFSWQRYRSVLWLPIFFKMFFNFSNWLIDFIVLSSIQVLTRLNSASLLSSEKIDQLPKMCVLLFLSIALACYSCRFCLLMYTSMYICGSPQQIKIMQNNSRQIVMSLCKLYCILIYLHRTSGTSKEFTILAWGCHDILFSVCVYVCVFDTAWRQCGLKRFLPGHPVRVTVRKCFFMIGWHGKQWLMPLSFLSWVTAIHFPWGYPWKWVRSGSWLTMWWPTCCEALPGLAEQHLFCRIDCS